MKASAFIPFPSILIRSERIDFAELTDEFGLRSSIVPGGIERLDQSDSEKLLSRAWTGPHRSGRCPWGNIGSGNKRGNGLILQRSSIFFPI